MAAACTIHEWISCKLGNKIEIDPCKIARLKDPCFNTHFFSFWLKNDLENPIFCTPSWKAVQTVKVLHLIDTLILVCYYIFMLALMDSFVKKYGLKAFLKNHCSGILYECNWTSFVFASQKYWYIKIFMCALMASFVTKTYMFSRTKTKSHILGQFNFFFKIWTKFIYKCYKPNILL